MKSTAIILVLLGLAAVACGGGPSYSVPTAPSYITTINAGIHVASCDREYDYVTVSGTLKNDTPVTIEFVELKVYLVKDGSVIDTDSTYAVGSEGLAPGETTQWEWMFGPNAPYIDQCGAKLLDYNIR